MKITPAAITVPNLHAIDNAIPGTIRKLDAADIKLASPAAFLAGIGFCTPLENLRTEHKLQRHVTISFLLQVDDQDDLLYVLQHLDAVIEEVENAYLITATLAQWVATIREPVVHYKAYRKMLADIATVIEMAGYRECLGKKSIDHDGVTRYLT